VVEGVELGLVVEDGEAPSEKVALGVGVGEIGAHVSLRSTVPVESETKRVDVDVSTQTPQGARREAPTKRLLVPSRLVEAPVPTTVMERPERGEIARMTLFPKSETNSKPPRAVPEGLIATEYGELNEEKTPFVKPLAPDPASVDTDPPG